MKKLCYAAFFFLISASVLFAAPANTARLDGRPTEYDSTELRASLTTAPLWGEANVITNLYVTWDEDYLYIALQGWEADNKLSLQIDVDPDAGTGALTTTNWVNTGLSYLEYNDMGWLASTSLTATAFGMDYMLSSEGFYNNILRITYDGLLVDTNEVEVLFDEGNGATPRASEVDMVVLADGTACPLKGFEARIPWSELYAGTRFGTIQTGETVPRGAALRMFANLHNNVPNDVYSSSDSLPEQTGVDSSYLDGLLITDTYVDITVDGDNDGLPDVSGSDGNAPFIIMAQGLGGTNKLWVMFNEEVEQTSAENTANWDINGSAPLSVSRSDERICQLVLASSLNATGGLAQVTATGVEDTNMNTRAVSLCFTPTTNGIPQDVTVHFVLETASGFGSSIGASNFYINGAAAPLEWLYPPSRLNPLQLDSGSLYYRDVIFPAGTPVELAYKYSGELSSTGTNNYEAVRLDNYQNATRMLTLPEDGSSLVVTDYLGVAAAPLRDPDSTNDPGYEAVYADATRGDAGVRQRTTVTFQLDLSAREPSAIQRVLIQGTDPLRGFNSSNLGLSDYAGEAGVGWDVGGLPMYDDGTHGDQVADDGVYALEWAFSTDGIDSVMEPTYPYSLVGGGSTTLPYYGFTYWFERRSPRSFKYKFYVVDAENNPLEYPAGDIEEYLPADETNMVYDALVWGNNSLPFLSVSNAPEIIALDHSNSQTTVIFTNVTTAMVHGAAVGSSVMGPWNDYGFSPVSGGEPGLWTLSFNDADSASTFVRLYAGDGPEAGPVHWSPNPVPATGATLRVYYNQNGRALAGRADVNWYGANPNTNTAPYLLEPMTFVSNGIWMIDLPVAPMADGEVKFLFTDPLPSIYDKNGGTGGGDYSAQIGGRATWSPDPVAPGDTLTITYDAAGGPLATSADVSLHLGFDGWESSGWQDVQTYVMTPVSGTVWTADIAVPSNRTMTVNFVTKNAAETTWDNNNNRNWAAFIGE